MPYVYSFCQIFQALCLLSVLRLFRSLEQFDIYGPSEWDFTYSHRFIKWQYLFHSEVKSFLKEKNYFATLFTLTGFKIKSRQKVNSANDKLNMTNIFAIIECFQMHSKNSGLCHSCFWMPFNQTKIWILWLIFQSWSNQKLRKSLIKIIDILSKAINCMIPLS